MWYPDNGKLNIEVHCTSGVLIRIASSFISRRRAKVGARYGHHLHVFLDGSGEPELSTAGGVLLSAHLKGRR